MSFNARYLLILCLILALSIGFGLAFDAICTAVEYKNHPRPAEFAQTVAACAEAFGVPENILWAAVLCESDFQSNKRSENGAIGLLQITPERLDTVCREVLSEPTPDVGILYDPDTNLRVGTAEISYLYQKYGSWEGVFAARLVGISQTDLWYANPDCLDDRGSLAHIPDKPTAAFVARVLNASRVYTELYY